MNPIELAESGLVPDFAVRLAIRRLLHQRLQSLSSAPGVGTAFVEQLRIAPLAVETEAANHQHYEVPAEFFEYVLGPRLKYSSCYYTEPHWSLREAEEDMLRRTCGHAGIEDGMTILDLGCGWGSLSLWIAEHFPNCRVTALSNSTRQRAFIEARAAALSLHNISVLTCDMRDFDIQQTFDRIVSVEMFEHMRNYQLLLQRVSHWLAPNGRAFVHVFCHRHTPYLFETEGAANWMGRHFFTGGMMPSEQLFSYFENDLTIERQWRIEGLHYWRTCEAWLQNLDQHRTAILARFEQDLSRSEARRSLQRWRIFFMACAELFRYRDGNEWFVAHYLFRRQSDYPCQPAATESGKLLEAS